MKNFVTEIISFRLVQSFTEAEINKRVTILNDFYKQLEGYHEQLCICKDSDNEYTLILKWSSFECEKEASAKMMKSSQTSLFKAMVDPKTVNKKLYTAYHIK